MCVRFQKLIRPIKKDFQDSPSDRFMTFMMLKNKLNVVYDLFFSLIVYEAKHVFDF